MSPRARSIRCKSTTMLGGQVSWTLLGATSFFCNARTFPYSLSSILVVRGPKNWLVPDGTDFRLENQCIPPTHRGSGWVIRFSGNSKDQQTENLEPAFRAIFGKILCDSRFSELSFVESIPKDSRRARISATLPATVNRTTSEGFGFATEAKPESVRRPLFRVGVRKRSTPAL